MTNTGYPQAPVRELRVISADTLVAGTHFLKDTQAGAVASKSLAVNLSDLAAMGARPLSVTVVITVPRDASSWQRTFLAHFELQCRRFEVALSSVKIVDGPLQISVQAVGQVPEFQALRRDGAQTGEQIYVSGTLGDAGLGLQVALGNKTIGDPDAREWCLQRLNRPIPRIALGLALRGIAGCAIDVSDGLCGDLHHLCRRSRVGMRIQSGQLPLSAALREHCSPQQALNLAMSAGDDYELCFTAREHYHDQIMNIADQLQLPVTRIGTVVQRCALHFLDDRDREIPISPAYQHFQTPPSNPGPEPEPEQEPGA